MGEPQDWRRPLVAALGAIVAVGLVIGGVLGVVTYGAARVAGIADGGQPRAVAADVTAEEQLVAEETSPAATPTPTPDRAEPERVTASEEENAADAGGKQGARSTADRGKKGRDQRRKPARAGRQMPILNAHPAQVRPMARVNLTGRYPGRGGTRLVVQRFERGSWSRFPVSPATVREGRFRTWVASGRPGVNRFRVVDTRTGRASAPVTVRVR